MQERVKLEIHFHDQQAASVVLESGGGPHEQFVEVLLFCSLALRQMVNLGNHSVSRVLAQMLVGAESHLGELAHHDSPDGAKLVAYQGAPGAKRFLASLTWTDDQCSFQMKAKGFGWFGIGIGYYAPQSVCLLLRYLSLKRLDNDAYLRWLGAAAASCGRAVLSGTVDLMNQAELAAAAASPDAPEPRTPTAPPMSVPEVRSEIPQHAASVEDLLRTNGARLCIDDFAQAFMSDPPVLTFDKLDLATRLVFHELAKRDADTLADACGSAASAREKELRLEAGKGIFDGYLVGRLLLGTHAAPVPLSHDSQDAQLKATLLLRELESVKPVEHLQIAGEHASQFLANWAEYHGREGVYSRNPDAHVAGSLLLGSLLNGFSLAISEYRVADPLTKSRLSQEACATLARLLAQYAIQDFKRDQIDELMPFDCYSTLSALHKATWLSLRLALQLRCVAQVPSLTDDHRRILRTAAAETFTGAGLGITSDRFAELQAFERSMCGTRPRASRLAPERPATQYLLFGFFGCLVNNCSISPLAMKRHMADLSLDELNAWLRQRGATVEIPLNPVAMLEYTVRAHTKVQVAKALIEQADQLP